MPDTTTHRQGATARQHRADPQEAEVLRTRLLGEIDQGRVSGNKATVAELLQRWLDTADHEFTTRDGYERYIATKILPALGRVQVRKLTVEALDQFYAELRKRGGVNGRPLAGSTVRKIHFILGAALGLATLATRTGQAVLRSPLGGPRNRTMLRVADVREVHVKRGIEVLRRAPRRWGSPSCHCEGRELSMNQEKLVRDRIPQIIRSRGDEPVVRVADRQEYRGLLRGKLAEEVGEFLASEDPEELADILEVVLALAAELGVDRTRLETLRATKAAERGGFAGRIVWQGNRAVPAAMPSQ
ncbi:MAG: hypothetical protein ACRDYA_05020 [Egibacteraceae bacterium]